MLVISLSLLHKTRDTPSRVNREVSKSFDMNNWHLLRKGEKLQRVKESGKRIFGLATVPLISLCSTCQREKV
jgi:hypothetical protein